MAMNANKRMRELSEPNAFTRRHGPPLVEQEAQRHQKLLWGSNQSLAMEILNKHGPEAYVGELKSNLLLHLTSRNTQLAEQNIRLVNQINELFHEHLALQFEYDQLLRAQLSQTIALETTGVLNKAQEDFEKSFPPATDAPIVAVPTANGVQSEGNELPTPAAHARHTYVNGPGRD